MREAHQACIPPRYIESDLEVARFEHGVVGMLGERPLQSRRSLLLSMYPELREGTDLTAAMEVILREQPASSIHSFVRRIRRALKIQSTHVWRRDDRGVVSCVETREMSLIEQSTSFRGPPENLWTYLVNVEEHGFRPPTLIMVANLIRGMCRPDRDQAMALLTELIQTGLYTQELLNVVYRHMVSMADVMNSQRITADNVNSLADNAELQTECGAALTKLRMSTSGSSN